MSDEIKKIGELPIVRALKTGGQSGSAAGKGIQALGKDEFLRMLVTQLKNQDPMDPMKSDDFAVNLAQFSQLEQLIAINQKLGESADGGGLGGLAAFLGQEVTVNSNIAEVKNHDGGRVRFQMAQAASNVKVELLDVSGSVKETINLGALEAGRHSVALSNLNTASGEYEIRVTVTGLSGGEFTVEAYAAGIVTGFIPGAEPALLLGERQVTTDQIKEVNAVKG